MEVVENPSYVAEPESRNKISEFMLLMYIFYFRKTILHIKLFSTVKCKCLVFTICKGNVGYGASLTTQ